MTPQLRIESPGAVNYVNARGTEKKPGFTEIHFTHRPSNLPSPKYQPI
jgi:hypothetical protein